MSWWTQAEVYPKRKNKFVVVFGGNYRLWNIKTCTLPSVEVATKEYTLINHKFNYPGIPTWQPVKMTFVDVFSKAMMAPFRDTSEMLFNILNNSGYYYPEIPNEGIKKSTSGKGHILGHNPDSVKNPRQSDSPLTTTEKASTIANSFGGGLHRDTPLETDANSSRNRSIQILLYDADDVVTNAWFLVNPIITNISWGELDYSSDELLECTLDLKYDWAEFMHFEVNDQNALRKAQERLDRLSQRDTGQMTIDL